MGAVVMEKPYRAGPGRSYRVWIYPEDRGFPGGWMVKNLAAQVGDTGSILIWKDPTGCRAAKPVHHDS